MHIIHGNHPQAQSIGEQCCQWIERVILGLQLCPFAKQPYDKGLVRIVVSDSSTEADIIAAVLLECGVLDKTNTAALETTLLITPNALKDFDDYLATLSELQWHVNRSGYEGVYQIASFHPLYQFDGTAIDDPENHTNRAPYPCFHLLREDSLSKVIDHYPDVEQIPHRNIARLRALSAAEFSHYFTSNKPSHD